ncbi:MAG: hypothetical protein H6684_06205 [Deltaproteobacteria bacterium]|nr:hypothetical protein [Deltaproteobacteria bacterium]
MNKPARSIQLPPQSRTSQGAERAVYDGYWLSRRSDVVARHCAVAALLSSGPSEELLELSREINRMVRDNYRRVRDLDEAWYGLRESVGEQDARAAAEQAMAPIRHTLDELDELLALAARTQRELFSMGWDIRDVPDLGVPPWPFEDEDVEGEDDDEAP